MPPPHSCIRNQQVGPSQKTVNNQVWEIRGASPGCAVIKNPPANAQDSGSIPGLGRSTRQQGMATHSSVLVWEIPWTEETGGLQSMGSQRDECDLGHTCMHACGKSESQYLAPWTTRLRPLSSQRGQTTCPAGSHMMKWVRNWDGSITCLRHIHIYSVTGSIQTPPPPSAPRRPSSRCRASVDLWGHQPGICFPNSGGGFSGHPALTLLVAMGKGSSWHPHSSRLNPLPSASPKIHYFSNEKASM